MPISDRLLHEILMNQRPPTGGYTADAFRRESLLDIYNPAPAGGGGHGVQEPGEATLVPVKVDALVARLQALNFTTILRGGSGSTWTDNALVNPENMIAVNDAPNNGTYVTYNGEDQYFETAGTPAWAPTFSGQKSPPSQPGWNRDGITVIMLFRSTNLRERTIIHWKNAGEGAGDETRWMCRFNGQMQIQFWNQYDDDSLVNRPSYVTNPPGDRYFTIPIRFTDLENGKWHLLQFARGSTVPPETKEIMVDGNNRYKSGTGNGVNGFQNPDVKIGVGKLHTTTLSGDFVQKHFKGDIGLFAMKNDALTTAEMESIARAAGVLLPSGEGISVLQELIL